ncbi:hypothetical protein CIHG_00853 [Coccidioides immitis H538.4]|uniref:Uncharacterized protein n=2 Tax=Coccidioides immitis TaxID=5501 RepID=A0A0J8RER0_COCIT|nr:hypothetical protein CIRG_03269 [Coccidioides immitis RMSCC 2394]KMU83071.1 hypothetical protein CIHG_00853 [Coccidioides immitis H538.4]
MSPSDTMNGIKSRRSSAGILEVELVRPAQKRNAHCGVENLRKLSIATRCSLTDADSPSLTAGLGSGSTKRMFITSTPSRWAAFPVFRLREVKLMCHKMFLMRLLTAPDAAPARAEVSNDIEFWTDYDNAFDIMLLHLSNDEFTIKSEGSDGAERKH